MTKDKPFRLSARIASVRHACAGLAAMVRHEHNCWIHLVATIGVVALGFAIGLSAGEWTAILVAIVLVWMAEALNTAFELLCDVVQPEFHPAVRAAKDVAAGAVLVSAIGAAAIGALVFLPHLR
jgi:diacylglycerol kinase (ATP)